MEFVRTTDAILIHSMVLQDYFVEQGLVAVETDPDDNKRIAVMGIHVLPERRADPKLQSCIDAIIERAEALRLFPYKADEILRRG